MDEQERLINDEPNNDLVWKITKNYGPLLLAFAALALSIYIHIDMKNTIDKLEENKAEELENKLKKEIKQFGDAVDTKIQHLSQDIDAAKGRLEEEVNNVKTTLELSISNVRNELLKAEGYLNNAGKDIATIKTALKNIRASMETEHDKVWAEIAKLEKEIKNLPKNKGQNIDANVWNLLLSTAITLSAVLWIQI